MTTTDPGADKAVQALPEEIEHAICATSPGLLALAKRYAANTVHSYQFALEAEQFVRNAVRDALTHRQQGVVGQAEALRSALERTLYNFRLMLSRKPVRDAAETIAEAEAALTASPPAQPRKQCSTCGATSYADALLACHRSAHGDCPGSKLWPDGDDAGPDAGQPAQPQSEPCAWCCGTGRFADHACRFCAGKAAGSVFAAQPPERAAQQRADYVPMPTSADEAAMMCLIGEAWLRESAPERLRAAQQEPNAELCGERSESERVTVRPGGRRG